MARSDHEVASIVWVLTIFFPFFAGLVYFLASPVHSLAKRQAAIMMVGSALWWSLCILMVPLSFVGIGWIMGPIIFFMALYVCIKGAMECSKGRDYNPMILGDLARGLFKV